MTPSELLAYTQKELDTEAVRQSQALSESNGEELQNSQGITLDYSKRGITELPTEIVALIKEKVERLALAHNPCITIPKEIVSCERLRYLNIRASKLTLFPEHVLSLSQLEILDLSKNEITIIPEAIKAMSSLKFLAIVRNKVARLPLSLGDMPNLSKLKFEENPIEFPALDELQLPDERNGGVKDVDKDREMCQQVKKVLKSKALRQRILSPKIEEEASESNVETPRPPRRVVTGRFPVKPSVSNIDLSEVSSRSASNSPPDATQLTAKQSATSTPSKINAQNADRQRSASTSTTASIRSRRQGYVPSKRSNDLTSVSELNLSSLRSSNASTIKAMHAYKASNSSIRSALGSSSGADTSSGPASPATESFRSVSRPPARSARHSTAVQAARRLQFSLFQLHRPLHKVAVGIAQGLSATHNFMRHLTATRTLTEQLDTSLEQLDSRVLSVSDESELKRWIMHLVQSALKSFGYVMEAVQSHMTRLSHDLDPFYTRTLMHQLYSTTVEARNVLQLLDAPVRYISRTTDTSRALRSATNGTRSVAPFDGKPLVNAKRLRGATILRNEVSNSELRVIPPARSADTSRTSTMTSTFLSSATPSSGDTFPNIPQSAALPPRNHAMRSMMQTSSDEHEEPTDQFETIYWKLRQACDIASKALPNCQNEVHTQLDVAQRDRSQALGLWQNALRSYDQVAKAHDDLTTRLSTMQLKDPTARSQKDFWQLCDLFVSSWTGFAVDIKRLSSTPSDISTLRSLMKPMQRVVKDLSKLIVDSPLYHQAMKGGNTLGSRLLGPPFQLGLNTAQAIAVTNGGGSNPASATPTSAHLAVSVPATPLTAALGPAAQATLIGTPGAIPAMSDYFSGAGSGMLQARNSSDKPDAFAAVNTTPALQSTLPLPPFGRR